MSSRAPESWALFGIVLAVYVATLYPSVGGGDSGELVAAAHAWGVAHPPGYPLFTLLGKACASLVPWGTVAWRVNLLSAVCAALAAALLCRLVVEWTGRRTAGLAAGALFAWSPLVWPWAVAAEVFALNDLFVVGLLWIARRWAAHGDRRWAYAGAATLGLGLANHHTLIFLGVPLAAWMLVVGRESLLRPGRLAALAGCGLAGLVPYAYLPLAAAFDPPIAWGAPGTPAGFVRHLLRLDYGTLRLGGDLPAGSMFLAQLRDHFLSLGESTLWVGLPLAVAGAVALARAPGDPRNRRNPRGLGTMLVVCWASYVLLFHWAANLPVQDPLFREVTSRFWQLPLAIVCLWIGAGCALAIDASRASAVARRAIALGCLVLPAVGLALELPQRERLATRFFADYGNAILAPLPEGAVLLTRGDLATNVVRYLQLAEGARPDVVTIDQELLTYDWYRAQLARRHRGLRFDAAGVAGPGAFSVASWIDAQPPGASLWLFPELREGEAALDRAHALWPEGLPSRTSRTDAPRDLEAWSARSERALARIEAFPWPDPGDAPPGSWERVALEDLWHASHRAAVVHLERSVGRDEGSEPLRRARSLLERFIERHAEPPWYAYKNLGIACDRAGAEVPGSRECRDAAWRTYLREAPADEPDRDAIRAALAAP